MVARKATKKPRKIPLFRMRSLQNQNQSLRLQSQLRRRRKTPDLLSSSKSFLPSTIRQLLCSSYIRLNAAIIVAHRLKLFSYLTSPIVELVVGQGENETVLTAHQNLLRESPFLVESIANFNEINPVSLSLSSVIYRNNNDNDAAAHLSS